MRRNRRQFIQNSFLLTLSGYLTNSCFDKNYPRITILGGGIAGLYAAFTLKKAGIIASIYEAHSRVGGRIMTGKNLVAKGITTEIGGEFIDSSHKELLDLCKEFGLPLLDMLSPGEEKLIKTDYFIDGVRRNNDEIIDAFKQNPLILKDLEALNNDNKKREIEFDKFSIDEYLRSINLDGWLANLLKASFTSELGLDSDIQNCKTMLNMLSLNIEERKFEIYGNSDERYKVLGGNEQIITELAKRVQSQINTDYTVTKITEKNKKYSITFDNGKTIESEILIITLPFTALRNVKLDFEMPKMKRKCIDELSYGTQSKMFFGFKNRFWRENNYSGYVLSDNVHNGWDSSQMQTHNEGEGSYTLFLGGKKGEQLSNDQSEIYLNELNKIYDDVKANFIRQNSYNWSQNPYAGGAYACYKPHQMSTIAGWEGKPVGNIYFAGEHCSENFGGFMYGAVETSLKAVKQILDIIK